MEKEFDFNHIGKKMPYTVPDNFWNEMEQNVLDDIRSGESKRNRRRRLRIVWSLSAVLVAASLALMFIVTMPAPKPQPTGFGQVERAYANLSSADREYLLSVYQEDVFINE